MNQEIPFDNYNTLDYAMHRHDIERIEEVDFGEINKRLKEGWALLALFPIHNADDIGGTDTSVWGYMGVPRSQTCVGSSFSRGKRLKHIATEKVWNHMNKTWHCPVCEANEIDTTEAPRSTGSD